MSMRPFLDHVEGCETCRKYPRDPCGVGVKLLRSGADQLAARIAPNPNRGQA